MRQKNKNALALCCALAYGVAGLAAPAVSPPIQASLSVEPGGEIRFKHAGIQFKFDRRLSSQVFLDDGAALKSLQRPEQAAGAPSQSVIINGQLVSEFELDRRSLKLTNIRAEFGAGRRLAARAIAAGPAGSRIEQELTVELYDDYPQTAIFQTTYRVLESRAPLRLEKALSHSYRLDASALDASAKPYEFATFQGGSYEWGRDFVFNIKPGFAQENDLGFIQRRTGEKVASYGGGVPVVDLWTKQMGLAVAHLAPEPTPLALPARVEADGRVSVAVVESPDRLLRAGESFTTVKTMLMAHRGDFYAPLSRYAELMRKLGVHIPAPNDEAYQASWCGWGYEFNFRPEEMLGVRPKLREMGIRWVTIDDRWFDNYGDWEPRPDAFEGGGAAMKRMVEEFHRSGFKAQLWWYPLACESGAGKTVSHKQGISQVVRDHPDWLIEDSTGKPAVWSRNLNILCPAVPGVRQYVRDLTRKFIADWGFDGHKLDVIYAAPPCYNRSHNHASPEDSVKQFPQIFRIIYETTLSLKSDSVTQICPCGTTPNFFWLPFMNQAVTADPVSSRQVRSRIKVYKALMGPRAAVYADHVELTHFTRGSGGYVYDGRDFASALGAGGVPGTKFVWPEVDPSRFNATDLKPRLENLLTPDKDRRWRKWFRLYNRLMLSRGEYLNLYDIAHDAPEGHAIRKDGHMYYAFYAPTPGAAWQGAIELRGLPPGKYRVYDYADEKELGMIDAGRPSITVTFTDSLLLEVSRIN